MGRRDYAAEMVTAVTGRQVPDILEEWYIERRHSQEEIAAALGVTRWQVHVWLKRYGLSRNDRAPVELEATA